MTTIAISQVEGAINRARARQPPSGAESALSLEVSTLAALYGRMIFERRERVERDAVEVGAELARRAEHRAQVVAVREPRLKPQAAELARVVFVAEVEAPVGLMEGLDTVGEPMAELVEEHLEARFGAVRCTIHLEPREYAIADITFRGTHG